MDMGSTQITVSAREGRAIRVLEGARLQVVDLAGGQIVDTWAFCQEDIGEFQSAEHTRVAVGKLFPALGEDFVTNRRRPILRFEEDSSPGSHDMLIAACDPTRYQQLGVVGWHASCQENLRSTMAGVGFRAIRVPQPINLFMNTPVLPDGNVRWLATRTQAGDQITLRALMDIWFVVSACPQDITGINTTPGPISVIVSDR